MAEYKDYTGIDCFRLIAAILVVAIHTSPLASYWRTGDFILTRIIARTAVPFFFMTSGFFLISEYSRNAERLLAFLKKTAVLYGAAMLLYLPVNIYNGYFQKDYLLPNIIKDVIFDGTFYHLWYLPASMTGAVIAWLLVKKLRFRKALVAAGVLYMIGLFGDSYYGMAEKFYSLNYFYRLIFQVSDQTRNGIFFAPVFFVMGGMAAARRKRIGFWKCAAGFGVCFVFLSVEAFALHRLDWCRYDSLYVFLPPYMYFLFCTVLHFKGKRLTGLRTVALQVYLVHPMMIIVVRMIAKLLCLYDLLGENSMVHYLAVCIASAAFGLAVTAVLKRCVPQRPKYDAGTDRAYLEIDLGHLEHNVKVLKEAMPPKCELMAVVKAGAYGHGMYETAVHINQLGVRAFAVATIDEGIRLRQYGISGEILILGYTAPVRAKELCRYALTQTLVDYGHAVLMEKQGINILAHVKVDTGMHRLGFDQEDADGIASVFSMKHIKVSGIYTHLCAADSLQERDINFTHMQVAGFYKLLKRLGEMGVKIPRTHIQSSYGMLNYPKIRCDYIRVGIALYGVPSAPGDQTKLRLDLRPVLSLKAKVVLLRKIRKGDSVGYGRSFVADRDCLIAVLPVGYADGWPRNLSCGKSYVLLNGHRAPVVGKICMDQLAVDVTEIPGVKTGMIATLIGKDGKEEITAAMAADRAESISNELLSRMGRRLTVHLLYDKSFRSL